MIDFRHFYAVVVARAQGMGRGHRLDPMFDPLFQKLIASANAK
jgi:hypothetical protein